MEQIIEILTPWAKPFLVFCGFMLIRYLYRTVIAVSGFLRFYADKISLPYRNSPLFAAFKQQNVF